MNRSYVHKLCHIYRVCTYQLFNFKGFFKRRQKQLLYTLKASIFLLYRVISLANTRAIYYSGYDLPKRKPRIVKDKRLVILRTNRFIVLMSATRRHFGRRDFSAIRRSHKVCSAHPSDVSHAVQTVAILIEHSFETLKLVDLVHFLPVLTSRL